MLADYKLDHGCHIIFMRRHAALMLLSTNENHRVDAVTSMSFAKAAIGAVRRPVTPAAMLRRLRIALYGAVVLPLLLITAVTVDERAQLLNAAEAEALADVATLREHALKTIETDELLLREVDYRLQGMHWDAIRFSPAAVSSAIGSLHAGMPQVSMLTVTDADGRAWAEGPPYVTDGFVSNREQEGWSAQQVADQGTFFSRAVTGQPTGERYFGISRRRTTADERFDGTVQVNVATAYFSTFWSRTISGKEGAAVSLLRTDGEVLARFPDMGASLGPTAEWSHLLDHLVAQPLGGVYRVTSTVDKTERIFAYARVGLYPLVVGYGLSVHTVLAPWRLHVQLMGGFGALAAGAVALAVIAAMRQVHLLVAEQARRTAIEAAAQEGQRLELLGQLTAEITHDFANILQVMRAAATLIRRAATQPERVRSLADRLGEDAERGASLTQRMLDVVRPGGGALNRVNSQGGAIDLANTIQRLGETLQRLLGGRYRLCCTIEPACLSAQVRGDRSELELVIMNLAVNARDAMPDGGDIEIRATRGDVSLLIAAPGAHRGVDDLASGHYVRLSVTDTGMGMAPDILARAGEVFFTTKPRGKGTGLGLSGARGFVQRAGGWLTIESEVGRGTTVTLWLPAMAPLVVAAPALAEPVG